MAQSSVNISSLKKTTSSKETLSKKILTGRSNQSEISKNYTGETSSATLRSKTPGPVRSEFSGYFQPYSTQNLNFQQGFGGNVKRLFFSLIYDFIYQNLSLCHQKENIFKKNQLKLFFLYGIIDISNQSTFSYD